MGDGLDKDRSSSEFSIGKFLTCIPDTACPVLGGCVAFGSTLALSTAVQKVIGVSTATNVLPTLFGFATVCAASLITEHAAVLTYEMTKDPKKKNLGYIKHKWNHQISSTSKNFVGTTSSLIRRGKKRALKLPMHEVRV